MPRGRTTRHHPSRQRDGFGGRTGARLRDCSSGAATTRIPHPPDEKPARYAHPALLPAGQNRHQQGAQFLGDGGAGGVIRFGVRCLFWLLPFGIATITPKFLSVARRCFEW
eukprot:2372965-Prymnesium_polylepis.2